MKQALIFLLILIFGYGGIYVLSQHIENIRPVADEAWADEDLSVSGKQLGLIGYDFRGLMADWYWINSLQYIGEKLYKAEREININDLSSFNLRLLYPMLDNASTLDPQFMTIYSYGAAVLPAIDKKQAVQLIEKGIEANPNEWRLYHSLGYIYWEMKNYEKAAEAYSLGSQKENAPLWMKQMSVNMQAQGSSREFARKVYRQMIDGAEDDQTKSFAELRYKQLMALDQIDAVNLILSDYKKQNGNCPKVLAAIFPQIMKAKLPNNEEFLIDDKSNLVDPSGTPYSFEKETCKLDLSPSSKIPRAAF